MRVGIFTLYWVDTPETQADYPERLEEQANYFWISAQEVMQIGREAKMFTREYLKGDNLTLYSQWENGQGSAQRYYATTLS